MEEQNAIQINGIITININVSLKSIIYVKKDFNCNTATCSSENWKYLASMMDDTVITCDEIIDLEKTNFNQKTVTSETQNFYILLAFLLITIALSIDVSNTVIR